MGSRNKRIQEEYRDGADPGTHGIVEDTKREAYRTLTMAKRCNCDECVQLMKVVR